MGATAKVRGIRIGVLVPRDPLMGPPPEPNRKEYPYVGSINFQGILIYVENEPGSVREGTDGDGQPWRIKMSNYYGEIPGTRGADNDPVDAYVGPDRYAQTAFVLHQVETLGHEHAMPGAYDEDKVMLGFMTEREARMAYHAHFNRPIMPPGVTAMPVSELKERIRDGELSWAAGVTKARTYPVGTVREWQGKKHRKVAPGKWVPVGRNLFQPREPAEGGEVSMTKADLLDLLQNGTYSVISAGRNPSDPAEARLAEDSSKFIARHEALKRDIIAAGMSYTEVEGHYGGLEHSLIVFHHDYKPRKGKESLIVHHDHPSEFSQIRGLGRKYNQDSVIHSQKGIHELHFTTGEHQGEHHKGSGHAILPFATEFFTLAPTDPEPTKFSLNFDWDALYSLSDALLKARYTRRWKGPDGKWRYEYGKPKRKRRARRKVTDDESYERHVTELGAQLGVRPSTSSVGHKPGGGAISTSDFYINVTPMGLKRLLGNKPSIAKVEAVVAQVAREAGKLYDESPATLVAEMREDAARMGFRAAPEIKLLDQALSMITQAVPGQHHNDRQQGEVRALEILVDHFAKAETAPGILVKAKKTGAKPPGGGWAAIPRGRRGGFRRKKGKRYEYWYPGATAVPKAKKKAKPKGKKRTPPPPPAKKRETKDRAEVKVGDAKIPADWPAGAVRPAPQPEPGHEQPALRVRQAYVYKRSQAKPGSMVAKMEDGSYMLRKYQPRHARRMRLTIEVPGDPKDPTSDKSKLIREVTNVLHSAVREIGKGRISPMHSNNPDYMELLSAAHVGFMMCLGNYQGGRAFVPYLRDYAKAYAYQALRQMRSGVSIPDSKMRVLDGYIAAKNRARTLARQRKGEEPTAEEIAKTWYLTKRMIWTARADTLGRYLGKREGQAAIIDQAHELVPDSESWQVKGPTGKPLGPSYPSKAELVPIMERLIAGTDVRDDEWMASNERDLLPDHTGAALPAGTVLHLREEIREVASGMKKPWGATLLMRMGLYEPVEEDQDALRAMGSTKLKVLAREHGLALEGDKDALVDRIMSWGALQDRPGTGGRQATALEIAETLNLFETDKKGRPKNEASRKAATRRLIKQAWASLWDKTQQEKRYVAQFMDEWDVGGSVVEERAPAERHHAAWFPSHGELKERFGTDERVYVYGAAIRSGKNVERIAEILDAEKAGEAVGQASRWVREQYHEQRRRDAEAAFARYRAVAIDPRQVKDIGLVPGASDWYHTDTVLSDWMRARVHPGTPVASAGPQTPGEMKPRDGLE